MEYLNLNEMENKEFSKKLEKRTMAFAIWIITVEGKIIRNQLTKSGTSIGANYREANRSRSKADFKNKIKICESETSETCYWLEIIGDLTWLESQSLTPVVTEANELLAIFTSVGKSLKL